MSPLPPLLREPLVHFALVGALLFGADHFRSAPAPEPSVVRVTAEVRHELIENFRQRQGREPSPDEIERAGERWLEEEVLYREGVALGLAGDDVLIRNRVIEKMRFVLSNAAPVREPREEELRAFFGERRADYEQPRRYDLEYLAVPGDGALEQRASAEWLLRQLSQRVVPEALGAGYRVYEGRSAENVAAMFGARVETALAALPPRSWHIVEGEAPGAERATAPAGAATELASARAPARPAGGHAAASRRLHLIRVLSVENPSPPDFDAVRQELSADWQRRQRQLEAQKRLREIRDRYTAHGDGA